MGSNRDDNHYHENSLRVVYAVTNLPEACQPISRYSIPWQVYYICIFLLLPGDFFDYQHYAFSPIVNIGIKTNFHQEISGINLLRIDGRLCAGI